LTIFFGVATAKSTAGTANGMAAMARMKAKALAFWSPPALGTRNPGGQEDAAPSLTTGQVLIGACSPPTAGENPAACLAQRGPSWVFVRGLLCTRQPLMDRLDWPAAERQASDADLVLAAYRRWGPDCVQHLAGDWAFALWDGERQQLVLAKDPTGNCAIFWWRSPNGQLVFSNNLPTLVASGPVPTRPNPAWLAGLLTVFYDPAQPTATAFADVHALPPGFLLQCGGGQVDLRRWWLPHDLPPLDATPLDELQQRFLALYQDAVVQRLVRPTGGVAATLSGGLDSGSVVAFAAPALAGAGQRLKAYVHVPRHGGQPVAGRTTNEWDLALATARHAGAVDTFACPTPHISPVQAIGQWLDRMSVPSHAAAHWFWGLDIVEQAAAGGASVVLSGEGGNSAVSYTGRGSLWPRLGALQWSRVASELRAEFGGWPVGLRNRVLKPALRPAWHALKRWRADLMAPSGQPGWLALGPINPQWAAELKLLQTMHAAGHDPALRQFTPGRVRKWRVGLLGGADNTFAIGHALGLAQGLEWRDPTKDRRLVELCWQLPDELFWAHGLQRGLVRAGMQGRLPAEVLDSHKKGLQSSDLRERLASNPGELVAAVDGVASHPLVRAWFDVDRMQRSAAWAVNGATAQDANGVAPEHLMRALAAAVFITRHG